MTSQPILFSGSSNPGLAREIASLVGIPLGRIALSSFPDKEINVEIQETVQNRPIYVLQSIALDPNFYLMELLIILDALKRAAAGTITVVLPYFGYARQDRQDKPGAPITAKLVANLIARAGADRIIVLDLHSDQIEGFFDIPVEHLLSRSLLIPYCASLNLENAIVVAPDKGGIKIASDYAKKLGLPIALIDKERIDSFHVEMHYFVGEVKDRTVIIPDDMCSTGGTLIQAASACSHLGAKRIIAIVGHGLFIGKALEHLQESSIEMMISTNSIPASEKVIACSKIRMISVATLFAQAISQEIL